MSQIQIPEHFFNVNLTEIIFYYNIQSFSVVCCIHNNWQHFKITYISRGTTVWLNGYNFWIGIWKFENKIFVQIIFYLFLSTALILGNSNCLMKTNEIFVIVQQLN